MAKWALKSDSVAEQVELQEEERSEPEAKQQEGVWHRTWQRVRIPTAVCYLAVRGPRRHASGLCFAKSRFGARFA